MSFATNFAVIPWDDIDQVMKHVEGNGSSKVLNNDLFEIVFWIDVFDIFLVT